ncbi:transcriptional regulatory protein ZraR [bacterium BMS3Bbin07]|nr:transcriptional regulatory protein ZraR [bacterium BMS3Bbin07]HDH02292.1 sigma-54-dependent Fis family transcriptional regulator [Nitrospirota bacterium]
MGNGTVLIVDDEPNAIKVLSAILLEADYNVVESIDVDMALKALHQEDVDVVITDLRMPGRDGMQLFEHVTENHPDIPVIFLTAYGTVDSAVHAITHGAFYYFIKPPDYLKLKSILARAVEQRRLKREIEALRKRLAEETSLPRIIGKTPQMLKIFNTIETIKDSESSVIICGETGTGKELIARALHFGSTRRDRPFVAVNCAAIPRELLESELFGYERGAFTGAVSRRIGRFEEASGGTLFLDEIGELDLSVQSKMLRVLQEREIERLGSNRKIKVHFRLVSSTNRDLEREAKAGNFRKDLLYRLNVIQINVPLLRERQDDIPLLVSEYVNEFCIREKKVLTVSDEVMRIFHDYHWPGNVRQLRNVMERAVVLSKGETITSRELPDEFVSLKKREGPLHSLRTLSELESEAVKNALRVCNGNKSKAARLLGISRKALYKRIKDWNIE